MIFSSLYLYKMNSSSSVFVYANFPGMQDSTKPSPEFSIHQLFFLAIKSSTHYPTLLGSSHFPQSSEDIAP